jgi:hypothetical protein
MHRTIQHPLLALAAFMMGLSACASPELGKAPFRCNHGAPECPEGYQCNPNGICVKTGDCPKEVAGCDESTKLVCGDGKCEAGEDCDNCESDCGSCQGACGDKRCDPRIGEDCKSCAIDCGACSTCGDGVCGAREDEDICPKDCKKLVCGDGTCEAGETAADCPKDCKDSCGNGTCDADETPTTCPQDCKKKPPTKCGNGTCDKDEDSKSCPADCPKPACKESEIRCVDNATLDVCEQGQWKKESCKDVCAANNFDYHTGECTASSGCKCGKYGDYGARCNASQKCKTGYECFRLRIFHQAGLCTKKCSRDNECSGVGPGTEAHCHDGHCVFECDWFFPTCPAGFNCDIGLSWDCFPNPL